MTDDEIADHDIALARKAAAELFKHFDTVQIFATRQDARDGTASVKIGLGNWFARYGQISLWLESEAAIDTEDELKRHDTNDPRPE